MTIDVAGSLALEFSVQGTPRPQGSKTPRILGKRIKVQGGTAILNAKVVLIEQANRTTQSRLAGALDRWRARVAEAATTAAREVVDNHDWLHWEESETRPDWKLIEGPVWLSCEFVFVRPPSHWTKSGRLTKSAHDKIPGTDLSKLVRAVEDSLSKTVYVDDRQVVQYPNTFKRYTDIRTAVGGVIIRVGKSSPTGQAMLGNGEDNRPTAQPAHSLSE